MSTSMQTAGEELVPASAAESQLSSLVYDLSQNVQVAMDNMMKMITVIDHNSSNVTEEIEKSMGFILQRKKDLKEEKENLQKAATAVLDVLNSGSP